MNITIEEGTGEVLAFQDAQLEFEAAYVEHLLCETDGDVSRAAQLADQDRSDFGARIKSLGLDADDYKDD